MNLEKKLGWFQFVQDFVSEAIKVGRKTNLPQGLLSSTTQCKTTPGLAVIRRRNAPALSMPSPHLEDCTMLIWIQTAIRSSHLNRIEQHLVGF